MIVLLFFFNDTATTEIYTLSLHDALPIWAPVPVPGFDPHKLYRCRDPEFHATIHYTDADGRHYGYVWQNGNPPFPADWDSSGAYTRPGEQHMSWDLVNYSLGE